MFQVEGYKVCMRHHENVKRLAHNKLFSVIDLPF